MRRSLAFFAGLALAVAIGIGAVNGATDTPGVGGLTPLAPTDSSESGPLDQDLFIDGEPVTPFDDGEPADLEGSGMAVPGFEGDVGETVVETGSGMVVPGFEGTVDDMIVEPEE